jgi:hypothetical protein
VKRSRVAGRVCCREKGRGGKKRVWKREIAVGGSGAGVQGLSRLSLLAMNWFDLEGYGPALTAGVVFLVGMCFFFLVLVVVLLVRTYHQKRKRSA